MNLTLFLPALLLSFLTATPPTTKDSVAETDFNAFVKQLEQEVQGRVGVAATLLETGESVGYRADERFPMQSVYKFPISMAVLAQVDNRKLLLGQKVRIDPSEYVGAKQHSPIRDQYPQGAEMTVSEIIRYAVSESDGSASDVLLRLAGGAEPVMRYLKNLNVDGLIVRNTEKELAGHDSVQYANWAQPKAAVSLLTALHEGRGLTRPSRDTLLRFMTETPTGRYRLKGLLPPGTVVAHKTGTSLTVNNVTAATNDIGLITLPSGRHMAIAVFVSDARADQTARERVIARIAKALWDRWQ